MSRKKRTWWEENRIEQQRRYDECNTVQIKLKLNQKTDQDILDWIREQKYDRNSSVQGAIKKLIREELKKELNG